MPGALLLFTGKMAETVVDGGSREILTEGLLQLFKPAVEQLDAKVTCVR